MRPAVDECIGPASPALAQKGKTMKQVVKLLRENGGVQPEKGFGADTAPLRSEISLSFGPITRIEILLREYPLYRFHPRRGRSPCRKQFLSKKREKSEYNHDI